MIIQSFTFSPDNIKSNENVTLSIFALLKEVVTSGTIDVEAKLGPIPVYNEKLDLCSEVEQGGFKCPLNATNYYIKQTIPIPEIPIHGNIDAVVRVLDQHDDQLVCMQVKCHF